MNPSRHQRRRFGKPPRVTEEQLRRLRAGYEHSRDRINEAHAADFCAVFDGVRAATTPP